MNLRLIACALALLSFASCEALHNSPYKKKDDEDKKPMKDQSKDQSFQSFLGRLRIAVAKHDTAMLSTLMTPDFGYRWDEAPPGETAFIYWDQHKLWGELSHILQQRFVESDMYMVAPAEVVSDSTYAGYRVGARTIRGSWHLAYFVSGEGAR
ncbi:MAG TPA: hypothetical protein VK961_26395 [Chthoniobacter sp.]|nr:hypothetical protein [Chthoniobacter sp.]